MAYSLIEPLNRVALAFVDVETTGASAMLGDRVIEVGVVRVEGGVVTREYEQLINPNRRIGPGITALTGITQQMVEGMPTFSQQMDRMMEAMRGAVVVGHNVRFDLSFLRGEFRRCGTDMAEAIGQKQVLDTVRIARRRFGRGGNGLQILSRRLGYVPVVAHRALPDARTTFEVMQRLWEPIGGWGICLCDAMKEQGGPMSLGSDDARESLLPLELEEALENKRPVMMEYLDANEQRTQRVIEPIQVKKRNGELMLVAHCQLRGEQRTFKVERIVTLSRMDGGGGGGKEAGLFDGQ